MDAQEKFYRTLNGYYKAERERSEKCLADVLKIAETAADVDLRNALFDRLIEHYSRGEVKSASDL